MRKSLLQIACFMLISIWFAYIYLYNRINHGIDDNVVTAPCIYLVEPLVLIDNYENSIIDNQILIITQSKKSINVVELVKIFEINRFKYKIVDDLNKLRGVRLKSSDLRRSYFSLIIVDSLPSIPVHVVDHCRQFRIGIIYIKLDSNVRRAVTKCFLKDERHITKTNINILLMENIEHYLYKQTSQFCSMIECESHALVLKTCNDSIHLRQLIIGSQLDQILPSLIIDFLHYASYNRVGFSSERFIQIDIDDVFVARTGLRMKRDDVDEIIRFQEEYLNGRVFNSSLDRFKFNFGFSGFYYLSGNGEENLADKLIIGIIKIT